MVAGALHHECQHGLESIDVKYCTSQFHDEGCRRIFKQRSCRPSCTFRTAAIKGNLKGDLHGLGLDRKVTERMIDASILTMLVCMCSVATFRSVILYRSSISNHAHHAALPQQCAPQDLTSSDLYEREYRLKSKAADVDSGASALSLRSPAAAPSPSAQLRCDSSKTCCGLRRCLTPSAPIP